MQIRSRIKTARPESAFDQALEQELLSYSLELAALLNAGLKFGDNFNAQLKTYTTNAVANTADAVAHTLKRVPIGFLLLKSDKAVSLYDGGTAWTATTLSIKANVASATVTLLIV